MISQLKYILLAGLFVTTLQLHSQFYGGNGDGYAIVETANISLNEQDIYCQGGNNDGYDIGNIISTINFQNFYCNGGGKDGHVAATSGIAAIVDQYIYCNGGNGDGFNVVTLGPVVQYNQGFYCNGGTGDGFSFDMNNSPISDQSFYCTGGPGDGFDLETSGIVVPNLQDFYCNGGTGDGYFVKSSGVIATNDASFYCSGGNNSGYIMNSVVGTINTQNFYCAGNTGDGYFLSSLISSINDQGFYCTGGNSDGFVSDRFSGKPYGSPLFCFGGNGDGYHTAVSPTELFGIGIWTGITSTDWETGTNWMHNTVPGLDDNVTIPAACPNYPVVTKTIGIKYSSFFVLKCNRLEINSGASLSHSGNLYVEGEMKVAGNYTNTFNTNYSQRINNGGILTVTLTGYVKMGNQTSGTGLTDLMINDGGTVIIEGGTLEVDDQIRVLDGGTLNMSSGELFVHKYGAGSSVTVTRSAKFYIESGAMGEVSGGVLKICGLNSTYGLHSFYIGEPGFVFSGDATISFQNGVNPSHFDTGIYTVAGVTLQNLTINKPGNTVSIYSDLNVEQEVHIEENSSLKVEPGFQLTVGQ